MCGIYGVVGFSDAATAAREDLERMASLTIHRGPDDEGMLLDGELGLGMRRLSIIDLAGGHQPIANEDRTVWTVCNGEIYNFRELRDELEKRGHRFRSQSDAEVLVHLYEDYGEAMVEHTRGMFAFAVWDARRRRLLLARDRLGIKPLYLMQEHGRLAFASELKALLAVKQTSRDVDGHALREYLELGYVPGRLCMIKGIRKLQPGSLLVCQDGKVSESPYWVAGPVRHPEMSGKEWAAELRDCLANAVRRQMVSDVPLGAFLSGGIDSSAVVAFMSQATDRPVQTYSIGFGGDRAGRFYDELPYARAVAKQFGTDHREILVEPNVVELLPKLLWHMDEPVADSAFITTYLVAEFARETVKVILSGVGGDELFGGYRRYLGDYYARLYGKVPAWLHRSIVAPLARRLPSDRHSALLNFARYAKGFVESFELPPYDRYRQYVGVFPASAVAALMREDPAMGPSHLSEAFAAVVDTDPVQRLMMVDLKTQLPDDLLMLTDRMTMATSLECRVPLLDEAVVDLARAMPGSLKIRGRTLKWIMKQALRDDLPADILHRRKRGFGAPMGAWLKNELAGLLERVLSEKTLRSRGLFHPSQVRQLIDRHHRGAEDHTDHLQALLNFELWARLFLDQRSPEDVRSELGEVAAA